MSRTPLTAASYPLTLLASTLAFGSALTAQIPGSPTLQNAFLNPGLAVAGNVSGGGGQGLYALAGAWGLGSRFQVSAAAGAQRAAGATRGAYGARAAMSVWSSRRGSLGGAAFAGIGGAPRTQSGNVITNPATLNVPVGITASYQRPLGTTRGFSVYVSPMYRWSRLDDGDVRTSGTLRAAFGLDFAVTPSVGVTAGGELGRSNASRSGSGAVFGVAATFVPGRR